MYNNVQGAKSDPEYGDWVMVASRLHHNFRLAANEVWSKCNLILQRMLYIAAVLGCSKAAETNGENENSYCVVYLHPPPRFHVSGADG